MTCPLTAPDVPITEPATIYERLWVEREVAAAFRAFRLCDTCGAILDQPCRTASGKRTRSHKGRP